MSRAGPHDWPPVAETVRRAGLPPETADLAADAPDGPVLIDRLREAALFPEAVRYLAFALPKRQAVWWACRCVRQGPLTAVSAAPDPASVALEAAEQWAADPSETNRRAAGAAGESAGAGTPAGCAAMAAFWSGGSLAPEGLPVVPPADDLTARGVTGAVMIAAVAIEPQHAPDRFRKFLDLGLAVAAGSDRWASAPNPDAVPKSGEPTQRGASSRFLDTWE